MVDASIGRVTLVTGASSGIGRAVALLLATKGFHVIIHYSKSAEAAEGVARDARARGVQATTLAADLRDPAAAVDLAEQALAWRGRVDALVNNAAVVEAAVDRGTSRTSLLTQLESWDAVVNANLRAPMILSARLGEEMARAGGGVIVNVASVAGMYALTDAPLYSLTKAGLLHATRQLAQALAPKVRVNAVAPGWTRTGFGGGFILDPEFERQIRRGIPMRRLAEPDEIAEAVGWLTESASYVSGSTLVVDGGMVSELR